MLEALMICAIYLLPLFIPMIVIAFLLEDVIPYFKRQKARRNKREFF